MGWTDNGRGLVLGVQKEKSEGNLLVYDFGKRLQEARHSPQTTETPRCIKIQLLGAGLRPQCSPTMQEALGSIPSNTKSENKRTKSNCYKLKTKEWESSQREYCCPWGVKGYGLLSGSRGHRRKWSNCPGGKRRLLASERPSAKGTT
jgi:hypothetical protein